uniref:Uncharacterized protein n=1 Tax=Planktothrix pseudagardhii TaxID=132604 RepID=A0A9W4CHC8_9CYAN|nr:hypothetical protein NO713_01409 [Planktothrix pseudagardhii]
MVKFNLNLKLPNSSDLPYSLFLISYSLFPVPCSLLSCSLLGITD